MHCSFLFNNSAKIPFPEPSASVVFLLSTICSFKFVLFINRTSLLLHFKTKFKDSHQVLGKVKPGK